MAFNPVDPRVERYLRALADRHDEPVLLEMEQLAKERDFPIVGRIVGELLELLARTNGARTIFEMGSGYGYSAYWFARAVGPGGSVICTDGDPANRDLAERYLTRAGLWDRIDFHVGFAQDVLRESTALYDLIYNDINKPDYPAAWDLARQRIRPGGLYICDNVLWSGRVAEADPADPHPDWTAAIQQHNQQIFADPAFDATIVPTRDGVLAARRR
jgi:predicted O-methyltransferase YrrM